MSATLTVKREARYLMELRRGPFEITLDGAAAGSIGRDETFRTEIEAGHHTLQVRTGRYSSEARSFDAAEDEALRFRCSGARIWPIYLISLAVPRLALTLTRE